MGKIKDYSGQICGCWEVIERDMNPASKSHETFWKCKCLICGNEASVRKSNLDQNPRSCNRCKGKIISAIMQKKGYTSWNIGDEYGLLTIIGKAPSRNNHMYVRVQCACGSEPFDVRVEHLKGQCHGKTVSCGCIKESSGELKIRQILEQENIDFQKQYRVKDKNNNILIFDFVIFKNNQIVAAIEYNGEQHYHPIEFFGGKEQYEQQKIRDARKTEYCNTHAIKLQWIPYYDYDLISPDYLNLKNFLV